VFLCQHIRKLQTFKNRPIFGPPCIYHTLSLHSTTFRGFDILESGFCRFVALDNLSRYTHEYYKTVVGLYITFRPTAAALILKCASHYISWTDRTVVFNNFCIIENFESVQTINDKRKYKLQQLFEMLSLRLDTGLESFSPLVSNGPVNDGLFEVGPDLNQSLLQFSQVACWLLVYALLHAPQIL